MPLQIGVGVYTLIFTSFEHNNQVNDDEIIARQKNKKRKLVWKYISRPNRFTKLLVQSSPAHNRYVLLRQD